MFCMGMFPGKSLKSGVPEMGFQAVWGGNKSIGKVTLESGGGVRAVTFFPSMMLGGKKTISF
jgi:hypothetical protein